MAFLYARKYLSQYFYDDKIFSINKYLNVIFYSDDFGKNDYIIPVSVELMFMPLLFFITAVMLVGVKYFMEKKEYYSFLAIRSTDTKQMIKYLRGYPIIMSMLFSFLYIFSIYVCVFIENSQRIGCSFDYIVKIFICLWIERSLIVSVVVECVYIIWLKRGEIAFLAGMIIVPVIYSVDFLFKLHIIYFHPHNYFINGIVFWSVFCVIVRWRCTKVKLNIA